MNHYILKVEQQSGENQFVEAHPIEAEDVQKVKYHYHRTLKDFGWHDTQLGGKHLLQGPNGVMSDILTIRPIDREEYLLMRKYLSTWSKL